MLFQYIVGVSALVQLASAQVHGAGAQGSTMGPVAFLWPADRAWDGAHDNTGPCGSTAAIVNRTQFPIGGMGSIETTIADEAINMAIRIAYANNPTLQSEFTAVKGNVTELEPGHQCYPISTEVSTLSAGTNATIQLEYWGDDRGTGESFFACADITFVDASTFSEKVACFNVTASEFTAAGATPSANPSSAIMPTAAAPSGSSETQSTDSGNDSVSVQGPSNSSLSAGAMAGIAVGAIAGAALIFGIAFFALRRKRAGKKDVEHMPPMYKVAPDAASVASEKTAYVKS